MRSWFARKSGSVVLGEALRAHGLVNASGKVSKDSFRNLVPYESSDTLPGLLIPPGPIRPAEQGPPVDISLGRTMCHLAAFGGVGRYARAAVAAVGGRSRGYVAGWPSTIGSIGWLEMGEPASILARPQFV